MALWQLALDETGRVDDPDAAVHLVGFALRGPYARQHEDLLRQRLQQVFDGVPYPMHSSRLRIPTSHVVYRIAGIQASDETKRACAAAEHLVRSSEATAMVALREAVEAMPDHDVRREVNYEVLKTADAWLSVCAPAAYGALVDLMDEQALAMKALVRRLATSALGPSAFATVSLDSPRRAGPSGRWLDMFTAVHLRTHDLLRGADGADQLRVHVPTYDGIDRRKVNAVLSERPTPPWPEATASWTAVAGTPSAYGVDAPALIVVADWIANRMRVSLRGPLHAATERAEASTGLPFSVTPRSKPGSAPLPTCTSTGEAHVVVLRARAGQPAAAVHPEGGPAGVSEQANTWSAAMGGGDA